METMHITADANDHSHSETRTHNVAHHFESAQQQFDAGKLGMWLFLVTEVLFFSGLFVAYAVYRSNHPEVFVDAHKYLNTTLGAFNTIVLLVSSLTMAWAVRCAQLGQQRGLVSLLAATIALSSLFLGVKTVEYSHKWGEGLLWAGAYSAETIDHSAVGAHITQALLVLSAPAGLVLLTSLISAGVFRSRNRTTMAQLSGYVAIAAGMFFVGVGIGQAVEHLTGGHSTETSHAEVHGHGSDHDHAAKNHAADDHAADDHSTDQADLTGQQTQTQALRFNPESAVPGAAIRIAAPGKSMTGVFFSIYYAMTGVHAIHILAGMGVMVWLLHRSIRGDFGPNYFGPVDYVGLYWHLVDLVWIYLFPLLYLIR